MQNRQPLSKLRVGNCRYDIACKFPSCQYYSELFITKRGTVLFLSGKLENKFMYWILSDQLTIHNLSHYAWKKKNSKTDKKIKIKNVYPRLTSRYTLMRIQAIGSNGTKGQMKPEKRPIDNLC